MDGSSIASWSLPAFSPRDLRPVGGGVAQAGGAIAWIDVGRSLRVAGYLPLPGGQRHLLVDSLAGRGPLVASEPDEGALLDLLRQRRGPYAADELLTERGLGLLYRAVCRLRGVPAQRLGPAQVLAKALAARCPECSRATSLFCALLGDVAAQAALALGARGGVYVGGDLVEGLGDWFVRSAFRRRFEGFGRDREALRAIPTVVVRGGRVPMPSGVARSIATA